MEEEDGNMADSSMSYTDDELNLISERAAQIQRELHREVNRASRTNQHKYRKQELKLPSPPKHNRTPAAAAQKQSADNLSSAPQTSYQNLPGGDDLLGDDQSSVSINVTSNGDKSGMFLPMTSASLENMLQRSIDAIKQNVHLTTDDERDVAPGDDDRAETPRNTWDNGIQQRNESYLSFLRAEQESPRHSFYGANTHNVGRNVAKCLEEHEYQRQLSLLKYEIETEQKSAATKIGVLTEEIRTMKQLLEGANRRNDDLVGDLQNMGERYRTEANKNQELDRMMKTQISSLLAEVEQFKVFQKNLQSKIEEKSDLIDDLEEMLRLKTEENEEAKQSYGRQLMELKKDTEEAKESFEKQLSNQKSQLEAEKENALSVLRKKHEIKLREVRNKHEEDQQNFEQDLKNMREKMREREQEFDEVNRKQRNDFDEKLAATLTQERASAEMDQSEALRRQQMKYEDEIAMIKKRLNEELDFERSRCLEAERAIEKQKKELEASRDDLAALQRESVEAIKETQRTCETSCDMKMSQLRDELQSEHLEELSNQRALYNAAVQEKQTADLDIERLSNKVQEVENNRSKEQKKTLLRINKACAQIASCIGIQPKMVFTGASPGGDDTVVSDVVYDMKFDQLVKSALDNLNATAHEVTSYVESSMKKIDHVRDQFKAYQTEKELEVSDLRRHYECETNRMIQFNKDRMHNMYLKNMDQLKDELHDGQDKETVLRKTIDRQHFAIKGLMKNESRKNRVGRSSSLRNKQKIIDDNTDSSFTGDAVRRNLEKLQSLNSRVHMLNTHKKEIE